MEFAHPQKMHWGGWGFQFYRDKSSFWGPRPLQNEEPATNLARCFLYETRAPNPFFWCTFMMFRTTGLYKVGNLA